MIKYHVMALLCLAAAAICGIEAAVRFWGPPHEKNNGLAWLMTVVFAACIFLYFRVRKQRRKAGGF